MSSFEDIQASILASHEKTVSKVSVKAVGSQLGIMTAISIVTILAFSFFRPREKKVYAPKIKYQLPEPENPSDDPDYEPPPPPISNGFFAWISPLLHMKEDEMITNIGLDGATFLRFVRLLRNSFSVIAVIVSALLVVDIIYNLKYVASGSRNALSLLTIQNVSGKWVWSALAGSYLINFVVMYFIWTNWQAMVRLRSQWFRSPAYQTKIYSRTLMVTQVRKDYRSDEGLLALMGKLKVDGIKIGPSIDCTSIGRRLQDFPEMVEDHNQAVQDLEKHLVKYLKGGKMANKRPTYTKGGFLGIGGEKKDAIEYFSRQIKFLRDKIDAKRQAIDSLIRQERKARKGGQRASRIEGENYGFVTFKTISEAHRIARAHQGRLKELHGARLTLAPMPHDIVWQNISREPSELRSRVFFGFVLIGVICAFYTVPLLVISALANLTALTTWVPFLEHWKDAGSFGNWTFSLVSGILPSTLSFIFGYFLPIIMRRISKYQGASTRSRLDRAQTARYYSFMIISNLIIFSLLSVFYNAIAQVVLQIVGKKSASEILHGLEKIPDQIQNTYVSQSTYWLTWLPLRGFLVIFELIQLIKLAMVSIRRVMFSYTPRDIREMTKPGYFEYAIVIVNLLFVATVGLVYAPLAPLVALGACAVFWFSAIVYKYQLLYVYISRAESGGRMWNVYINRLMAACILMQLLMILTTAFIRRRWLDCIAAVPPVLIILAFKFYMRRTAGQQFKYYNPTAQEAEQELHMSMNEKRVRHAEMEKRFLHPALQADKLYTVMVHKSQESLAREVLSEYPWFTGSKHDKQGVLVKAVREENLEYDPARDGPRDEAHQAEWDARSAASTDLLGGKTEVSTPYGTEGYHEYPLPGQNASAYNSSMMLPLDNPSTDALLARPDVAGYGQPGRLGSRMGVHQHSHSTDSISGAPLVQNAQDIGREEQLVPYPPSAYTQPPIGYTPPTMRRTASGLSDDEPRSRWDTGSDIGVRGNAPSYTTVPQYDDPCGGGYGGGYSGQYTQQRQNSSGYEFDQYGGYGQPRQDDQRGGRDGSGYPAYGQSGRR